MIEQDDVVGGSAVQNDISVKLTVVDMTSVCCRQNVWWVPTLNWSFDDSHQPHTASQALHSADKIITHIIDGNVYQPLTININSQLHQIL